MAAAAPAAPPSAPPPPKLVSLLLLAIVTATAWSRSITSVAAQGGGGGGASWCVTRSDASDEALQTALDYACGAAADCLPIQSNGLCYLPNTMQAHASYAFNSYYQRKARAPGSCDFAGTATIAQTDPSYGSCVYPSSASTAGGTNTPITTPPMGNQNLPSPPTTSSSTTATTTTPIFGGGNADGGLTPGLNPPPFPDNSRAPSKFCRKFKGACCCL